MDVYKNFLYHLRKLECESPYLIIVQDYPPATLKSSVKKILDLPFEEFTYYGELKKICTGFVNYYSNCMDHLNEHSERYSESLTYKELMQLYDRTIQLNNISHQEFIKEFQPIRSDTEQQQYTEILSEYKHLMTELKQFGDILSNFFIQGKLIPFAKFHCHLSVEKTSHIFDFSHVYISEMLAERVEYIRTSMKNSLQRIRNNLIEFIYDKEHDLEQLYNEMYICNKERLSINRSYTRRAIDEREIDKKINKIRHKILHHGNHRIHHRLHEEEAFWSKKLKYFEEIAERIANIKTELKKNISEEKKLQTKHKLCNLKEKPGVDLKCWKNLQEHTLDLKQKYTAACKTLLTFFSCTGVDRVLYTGYGGTYYLDEYGHHNYVTDHGTKICHVNCEGEFTENVELDKYYFDRCGRYIIENGNKVYQLAPCTDKYILSEKGLLERFSKCKRKVDCTSDASHVHILNSNDHEILPKTEVIDIKGTLEADDVKYLWDTYGHILPEVLYKVAEAKVKNPIHYFAHVLLNKTYLMTAKQITEKKMEAERYRADHIKMMKEETDAVTSAWKAKLCRPSKPEALETTVQDSAHVAAQTELQGVIHSMQNF